MIHYFVSYRSDDAPHAAALIASRLRYRAGDEPVFLDTTSIRDGEPFPRRIQEALDSCHTLLAIIGPRWTGPLGGGRHRIDDEDDYVRLEVARALSRGIRTIPVLVGGAAVPSASVLPANLQALREHQAATIRDRVTIADVERLVGGLLPDDPGPSDPPGTQFVFHAPVTADVIGIVAHGTPRRRDGR